MTGAVRLSLASAVAALAAGCALAPLTLDRTYLLLALTLVAGSVGIGALLRRWGRGEVVVRFGQLAPALAVPWLVADARDPARLYVETRDFVQTAFAPMPFQVGFALFSALLVWVVYLLVETLSIGLASPAWTFPVLVLPYLVASLAIYAEANLALFGFVAVGYALVLATATRSTLPALTQPGGATAAGWRGAVGATAALATALALAATVLLALPIPERSRTGGGSGGSGAVQLGDPSLDLIRNVNSNSDQVLITYRSSDGGGHYLRLTALPVFDEKGFHLTATDLVPLPLADTPPPGTGPTVRTDIEIGALASEYLPVPWFPLDPDVPTRTWRYDPLTLAVVAIGTGRTAATRGISYRAQSVRLTAAEELLPTLADAGDPGDGGVTLGVPAGVSTGVRELARAVTAGVPTAGGKALALAEFLRSPEFSYSTTAASGTTLGTLDDFLLGDRIGYCEQFAGSLAVLARVVGIPSRVVVGFLPGRQVGGTWEVTARNMHAWTELYFDDVGWVPVDATPSGAAGGPRPSASPTPSASAATNRPTVQPSADTPTAAPPPVPGAGGGLVDAAPWLATAAGLLVLVAVGPRLARAALRRFRLAGSADPRRAGERAWAEVRAMVLDHGRDWPAGTSRQVAGELGPQLSPEGRDALDSLALTVERARYDREAPPAGEVAAWTAQVTGEFDRRWGAPAGPVWWPRSLRPRQRA